MRRANEDVTKLPKWAQDRIKALEMREAEWKEKALVGESESTNTWVQYCPDNKYLPSNVIIRFDLGDDRKHDQVASVSIHRGLDGQKYLNVALDSMRIEPRASNVVYISNDSD